MYSDLAETNLLYMLPLVLRLHFNECSLHFVFFSILHFLFCGVLKGVQMQGLTSAGLFEVHFVDMTVFVLFLLFLLTIT